MPGTELPQQNQFSQGGEANLVGETFIDDYYATFTHSEVCDVISVHYYTNKYAYM